jgi:chorismate synthase
MEPRHPAAHPNRTLRAEFSKMPIEIRPAREWDDCLQCEELQRAIWWTPEGTEVVPASLLVTVQKNGGLLLGAFDGPKMVGFVFGFLGAEEQGNARRIKHCSHMLAVLPEYRGEGLGLALKKQQREFLITQHLDLATWTYDPLQAINAKLNLNRLGAIVRRYVRDAYGEMLDALNVGVASDRFQAEWWLNSQRVRDTVKQGERRREGFPKRAQPIYQVQFDHLDLPRVIAMAEFRSDDCSIEIPADFNAMKTGNLDLAQAWRGWTRETFEAAFGQGYAAVEVRSWSDERGREHVAYVLKKDSSIQ